MIAATTGLVLLGTASCGGGGLIGGGGEQEPPKETQAAAGLKDFDPCAFPNPDELEHANVTGPGEPEEQLAHEPGCRFEGEDVLVTLFKNQKETVDSYETNGSWDQYEKIQIGGRDAAQAVANGSSGNNVCSTLVNAGGGIISVQVTVILPDSPLDSCGEAKKIATNIEPRLPK